MRLLSLSIDNNNNKLLLLLLFIASIIHVVTGLSVGSPAAGTKIQGSAQFLVSWSVGPTENITSVDIELAQGLLIAVKTIATLASDVPAAGGSRTVSMPASISSANNYYIRVKGNNIPSSVATQGPITYVAATTLPDNNSTSAARPTSTSSFSLILPGSSSASLPHSSSGSSSISRNTNLPSGTSSSIAEETSNSSNSDAGKDKGSENNGDNGLSGGAIAGIAIGAVAGAGAIVAIMMCVRRSGRDGDHAIDTSSEIFASPPGYHAETKNAMATAVPAPTHPRRQEYASTSPRLQQETQQGRFYSTGYETGGYYNNTGVSDPYYQQQQQVGYDQYNSYGYHPAAVYMPNLAHGHDQQQYQGYEGYSNEQQQQYWDPQQQNYPPQPVYYNNNNTSVPTQTRHDPPHSPTRQ